MKLCHRIELLFCLTFCGCEAENDERYLFFLHNRFLEEHSLDDSHPEYGRTEYNEIISEFGNNGLTVISEIRSGWGCN